jgi:iron complex transport system substrate-binding protein
MPGPLVTPLIPTLATAFATPGPRDAQPGTAKLWQSGAQRIVSIAPAVTEMLFAIDAGAQVVGVSSFDRFPPEVLPLPKVGALIDPDTERILSLRPDLVVFYGSQTEELARFEAAGIRTYSYRHTGIEGVFQTITDLAALTNRADEAGRVVSGIRAQLDAVRARVAARDRPRTLLVFGRQPGTLQGLYASGGLGFLHEMLEIAGGTNVFADTTRESVQPSHEALLAIAPEIVVEIASEPRATSEIERDRQLWQRLGSIPAVRDDRIRVVAGSHLVVPGPRLGRAVEELARALHPDAFQ